MDSSDPNFLQNVVQKYPHLVSPAALAIADTNGNWLPARHLSHINRVLLDAWATPNSRTGVNLPFQHGKSVLCSQYFPAWVLLLFPSTRICLGSFEEKFSGNFGSKVRDTIDRWGGSLGIRLRKDSRSKNEWVIEQHGGGMVCKGRHGALTGRPADLLLLDDTIKDASEAMSPSVLDAAWDWYTTTAYSRLGPTAPVVMVGTRWCKKDLFGRVRDESQARGEPWNWVKFKAISEDADDPLGRKPGEALWPERVPLERLKMIAEQRGKWFRACWQQEPEDEHGAHFDPRQWPRYTDLGDAYSLPGTAGPRLVLPKQYASVIVTVDWATSEKKTADRTCFGAFALLPDGRLLVLEIVAERWPIDVVVAQLDRFCQRHHPAIVAVESGGFQTALAVECRRHQHIPEVRQLRAQGKGKVERAIAAIVMGENERILLPDKTAENLARVAGEGRWIEPYCAEMTAFTGILDDHDDRVDVTAYAAAQANALRGPTSRASLGEGPTILTPGKEQFY